MSECWPVINRNTWPDNSRNTWPDQIGISTLIHGELSDLLTSDIVVKMKQAKPDLITATVPDRGHAPLLDEPQSLEAIEALIALVDGSTD
jgi:pimeloyl-ACP methyl ester carboxylesterase